MTENTGFTLPKYAFLPTLICILSCKGYLNSIWNSHYYRGPGRCHIAQGYPEPARHWNNSCKMLGETNSPSSQALSAPIWASLRCKEVDRWNSHCQKKKKKNGYCQLITVFYPLNFPERISKVFLNHFKKMRAYVSTAVVKSCMVCALWLGHNSHELLRMINKSDPALGRLPWSSLWKRLKPLASKALTIAEA